MFSKMQMAIVRFWKCSFLTQERLSVRARSKGLAASGHDVLNGPLPLVLHLLPFGSTEFVLANRASKKFRG